MSGDQLNKLVVSRVYVDPLLYYFYLLLLLFLFVLFKMIQVTNTNIYRMSGKKKRKYTQSMVNGCR